MGHPKSLYLFPRMKGEDIASPRSSPWHMGSTAHLDAVVNTQGIRVEKPEFDIAQAVARMKEGGFEEMVIPEDYQKTINTRTS